MTVVVYKNTDTSAPAVSGSVGDIVNLLDKCLVTGYGSKAAAGWSKPYTATNGAVFRGGSGLQHYYHVDDNGSGLGGAKEAIFRGSEGASAFQTATNYFPTVAQASLTTALFIRKSVTADATARAWIVVADDRTAYVHISTGDVAGTYYSFCLGEFYSLLSVTDLYRSIVIGRVTGNTAAVTAVVDGFAGLGGISSSALVGHYIPRSYNASGTATGTITKSTSMNLMVAGASGTMGIGTLAGVDPCIAQLMLAPISVLEPTICNRGRMRGMFTSLHSIGTFGDGDTIVPTTGTYAGRTFLIVKSVIGNGASGSVAYDTTGPWETN